MVPISLSGTIPNIGDNQSFSTTLNLVKTEITTELFRHQQEYQLLL